MKPSYSRRFFLQLAGVTAAAAAAPTSGGAAPRPAFEVSASLYAWDLHDEGIEKILDNLQEMSAVNSVYLIALMHYERRPLTSPEFTHNPVRKRGLKTGVEISHTVLDLDRAKGEFIDCVQRDINGEPRAVFGRAYPICLNSPDARQYVLNMFQELATRYDVDYLQTCTLPFMPGGADKGGCFCDSCVKTAREFGFDLVKARAVLKQNPTAQPELGQWQEFRRDSVARYYKVMHDGIHAIRKNADLRFNDCFNGADWGLDLKRLKPHFDSIRVCDYSEQTGDPARMKDKREWLTRERAAVGQDFPVR
jgi:hypothetical protein